MAVQYSFSQIVTSGLILVLDAADRNSYPGSGTSWRDISGNLKTGTLTNGPTFTTANGGGIVVDGTNDYIAVPNMVQTGLGFTGTIEIVTNCTGSLVFNERTNSNVGDGYFSVNSTGQLSVQLNSNTSPPYVYGSTSTISGSIGIINYYAASYQIPSATGTMSGTFFINGNAQSFSNSMVFTGVNANFTTIDIARQRNSTFSTSYSSPGNIYAVRIYNRQLSNAELLQNYNATKSRFNL